MRQPGTQRHNERTGGSGAKKATHDDEQTERGKFTKNTTILEEERGRTTERAPQPPSQRDQPAEKEAPADPTP